MTLSLQATLTKLPPEWPEPLTDTIRQRLLAADRTVVVLDDDPTGTQTVYDVPVLTEWSVACLSDQLSKNDPLFYVLTNSRSLPEPQAIALAQEIGANLQTAASKSQRKIELISRSDSTLRGHYPAEVDALASVTQQTDAVQIIAPFFLEGGRLTIDDVHYVAEGDTLTPAADTPFAQDAAFGFTTSHLKQWVAEKNAGRIPADHVHSISLDDLRSGGPNRVADRLAQLAPQSTCIVNAVTLRDIEVFTLGALLAQERGQQFIYRTAASFVQARAGLATKPLLTADDIVAPDAPAGLIVAGSYVPKTTAQLQHLHETHADRLTKIELSVPALLDPATRPATITTASQTITESLAHGRDALLFTSRKLVQSDSAAKNLDTGKLVSAALVEIVQQVASPLRFLIAKGGITSSDLATQAMQVRRATVLGQILPGVPVWRLGNESRQPGLGYVVFPGNVGDDTALSTAYQKLL